MPGQDKRERDPTKKLDKLAAHAGWHTVRVGPGARDRHRQGAGAAERGDHGGAGGHALAAGGRESGGGAQSGRGMVQRARGGRLGAVGARIGRSVQAVRTRASILAARSRATNGHARPRCPYCRWGVTCRWA